MRKTEFLNWEELPGFMQIEEVRPYWEILKHRKCSLKIKHIFDFITALILLILLAIPMLFIAAAIKLDSGGPVFYRQIRVTAYGRKFRIHKFRTMFNGADKLGAAVTAANDSRVTKIGTVLRKYRLDELPQLLDVLDGNMSFVGTRPEVIKYVKRYTPEMRATLLLPAGITSEASIRYKDENQLLNEADNIEKVYVEKIMPAKMKWNLESVRKFSFFREMRTMIRTVLAILGKNYR